MINRTNFQMASSLMRTNGNSPEPDYIATVVTVVNTSDLKLDEQDGDTANAYPYDELPMIPIRATNDLRPLSSTTPRK